MMTYANLTKEQLINEINQLKNKQNYGLVFKEHDERVINKCLTHIPIFEEIRENYVNGNGQDNLLLEGDNYSSLLALSSVYKNKINIIYIDPPYNTGNKDFVYQDDYVDKEDSWRHSKWLSFMNRRLKLAKELLSDDGVIFISIDDNEQAQLKLLCDSIFGGNNFIANIAWEKKRKASYLSNSICSIKEYILCYKKQKNIKLVENINNNEMDYPLYNASNGENIICIQANVIKTILGDKKIKSGIFKNKTSSFELLEDIQIKDGVIISNFKVKGRWRYSQKTIDFLTKNNGEFKIKGRNLKIYYVNKNDKTKYIKDIFLKEIGTNEDGFEELFKIFGHKVFNYSKPSSLIRFLINSYLNKNATILDFFAGSGTTFQAVAELNQEDGGQRKCILITNNENNICRNITYVRCKRVIEGYTTPKGKQIEGTGGNLHYYRQSWVKSDQDQMQIRENLKAHMTPQICMANDTFYTYRENKYFDIFQNQYQTLTSIILKKNIPTAIKLLKEEVSSINGVIKLYQSRAVGETDNDLPKRLNKKIEVYSSTDDFVKTYLYLTHKQRIKNEAQGI